MYKYEVEDYAHYEVWVDDNKNHVAPTVCLCDSLETAETIAKMLCTLEDEDGSVYYVTGVTKPGSFTVGGGWYIRYQKDKDGKIHRSEIS